MECDKNSEPKTYGWDPFNTFGKSEVGKTICQPHWPVEIACLIVAAGMLIIVVALILLLVFGCGDDFSPSLKGMLVISIILLAALILIAALLFSFEHTKRGILLAAIEADKSVQIEWIKSESFKVQEDIASLIKESPRVCDGSQEVASSEGTRPSCQGDVNIKASANVSIESSAR